MDLTKRKKQIITKLSTILIYSHMEKKIHRWEIVYDKVKKGHELNEKEQKIWDDYQNS